MLEGKETMDIKAHKQVARQAITMAALPGITLAQG